MAINVLKGC